MARSLIGLPVRLGLRGAGLAVHGVSAVAGQALGVVGRLAGALSRDGGDDVDLDGSPPEPQRRRRTERRSPQTEGPAGTEATAEVETGAPADAEAPGDIDPSEAEPGTAWSAPVAEPPAPPLEESPAHVSEEPTLVEELAEPGAEDGAGAEVHVAEPWDGYRDLAADDVIDRLADATTAELAAVELYEQTHRRRKTVLEAAERQLRLAAARPAGEGSPPRGATAGGGGAPPEGASGEQPQ